MTSMTCRRLHLPLGLILVIPRLDVPLPRGMDLRCRLTGSAPSHPCHDGFCRHGWQLCATDRDHCQELLSHFQHCVPRHVTCPPVLWSCRTCPIPPPSLPTSRAAAGALVAAPAASSPWWFGAPHPTAPSHVAYTTCCTVCVRHCHAHHDLVRVRDPWTNVLSCQCKHDAVEAGLTAEEKRLRIRWRWFGEWWL
jgi:hypothetical protein